MPTPPDDILINKAAISERCVRRMLDEALLRWIVESGRRDWIRLGAALGAAIRP